jgi:hypothetical protein
LIFDFGPYAVMAVPAPPIWPQLLNINKAGTRLFVTLRGQAGKVVMLIADPERPHGAEPDGRRDLGLNSGPHYQLTSDEDRLVVSDYSSKTSSRAA